MDYREALKTYRPSRAVNYGQQPQQPKKQGAGGFGGLLLDLLPFGRIGEKLVTGRAGDISAGEVGLEALLTALPFGLGRAAEGARAVRGVTKLATEAGEVAGERGLKRLVSQEAGDIIKEPGRLGSAIRSANRRIQVGDLIPGTQRGLGEEAARSVNRSIDVANKGLVPRSLRGQISNVQKRTSVIGSQLAEATRKENFKLTKIDKDRILNRFMKNVDAIGEDVSGRGAQDKILDKFSKITSSDDLIGLEKRRMSFDQTGKRLLRNTDAQGNIEARISVAARDAIDKFVTKKKPILKSVKSEYRNSRMAEDLLAKTLRETRGSQLNSGLAQMVRYGAPAQVAKETIGKATQGAARAALGTPLGRGITGQALVRVPGAGQQAPQDEQPLEDTGLDPTASLGGLGVSNTSPQPTQGDITQQQIQEAILIDLEETGGKNLAKIQQLAKLVSGGGVAGGSGLNVTKPTQEDYTNAVTGLQSLQQLAQLIEKDPKVVSRTRVPGRGVNALGIGSNIRKATGTGEFDALAFQAVENLLRIQTGAAAPEQEVRRYVNEYIPQPGDSPKLQSLKLQRMAAIFDSVLGLAQGTTNSNDNFADVFAQYQG